MKATWKKYEVHHSWESDRLRGIGISVTNLCVVVPRCLRSLKSCNTTVQRPLAMYMWDSFSIGRANSISQAWSCQGLSEAYHHMSMTLATYTESPLFPPWHIDMLLLNPKILQRYRKVGAKGSIFAVSYVSCHQCACICERSKRKGFNIHKPLNTCKLKHPFVSLHLQRRREIMSYTANCCQQTRKSKWVRSSPKGSFPFAAKSWKGFQILQGRKKRSAGTTSVYVFVHGELGQKSKRLF